MSEPRAGDQAVERRVVTVLFADLVGFTSLSEGLDAEEVAAVQDRYFDQVRETIGRYGGRLEKFIGDAAMAVFGVPRARDDDAERAVRAGLALTRAVEALSADLGLGEGDGGLRLRVGINTGEVAYSPGAPAADGDADWRVSGDTVNTSARLQAAAEPQAVLVGDGTALAVAESILVEAPVDLALKGKEQPVRAWRAVTPLPSRSRERAMGALRAPLLGRERQLADVGAALERVRAGATETLIVVAPPGVGKTRLLEEIADRAWRGDAELPVPVLRARLRPDATSPATLAAQLILATLDRRLGPGPPDDDVLRAARIDLAAELLRIALPPARASELTAEVARLLSEPAEPASQDLPASGLVEERAIRFTGWIEALDALEGGRAAIWLIEDLHWSGGDILAFLEHAAGQPAAAGRLVLATARPSLLEQLAERPAGAPPLPTLEVPPLAPTAARELVTALVGDALPEALVEAMAARSDGNPLFIEELLRAWISVGTLVHDGGRRWRLTAPPDEVPLPQTVQQIYAAQLDDLPGSARTLVRRASVAGRHVPRHSLDALEVTDTDEALEIARRRALLADGTADDVAGPSLVYRHALLRDAGYGSLARAERARLHARLAAWYERAAGSRADEVAEQVAGHYAAAIDNASRLSPRIDGDLDVRRARQLAIEWYERAARWALADASHESARAQLQAALAHAGDAPPAVRSRLLRALGEATAYTADMDEGARLLGEALELARGWHSTASDEERAAARGGYAAAAAALGRVWVQQVRFDDAAALAAETMAAIGGPDDDWVARLLAIRGWVRSLSTDRSSIADLDRALEIATDLADRRLQLEIRDWRAMALGEVGLVQLEDWQAVEELALELGDWSRAVKSMRIQSTWNLDDDHEAVWPLVDRAAEIARRRGLEEDLCWLDYARAEAGLVSGDWERALEAGRRVIDLGERNSYDRAVVRTLHVLLPIATERGERDLVAHACEWHEARRAHFPDSPYARIMGAAIDLHGARAGLRAWFVPEVEPRLVAFDGAAGGPSWLAALEEVVACWLGAGLVDAVRDALGRMDKGIAEEPEVSHLARGSALLMRAWLGAADGAPAAEVATVARLALTEFRRSRAPWWMARALSAIAGQGQATSEEAAELIGIRSRLGVAPAT